MVAKFYYEGQDVFLCPDCKKHIFYAKDLRGQLVPCNFDPPFTPEDKKPNHSTLHVCGTPKPTKTHDGSEQIPAFNLSDYTDPSLGKRK